MGVCIDKDQDSSTGVTPPPIASPRRTRCLAPMCLNSTLITKALQQLPGRIVAVVIDDNDLGRDLSRLCQINGSESRP